MPATPAPADAYVVIGNPIAHSRSPQIHQWFAEQTGQALRYSACLAPIDGFAATLARLQAEGVKGCNVTVPFKYEAAQCAHRAHAQVALAQAANTLILHPGGEIEAFNTDGAGLVRDITHNAATPLAQRHVLLLGAGGAAAGVLAPLIEQRPAAIAIANRSADKAQALAQRHAALAAEHGVTLHSLALDAVDAALAAPAGAGTAPAIDVLINATASSLQGQRLPIARLGALLADGALAYDMMYGAAAAAFLDEVRAQMQAAGKAVRVRDGLGMLVEQAAQAFAIWRSVRPDSAAVLARLRRELA
ncbi:MAG: shikimate dehydrogenase [Comamonadaceae bacterium]|nr:shikimate dehydrogenase [Comamonadaceae bacterium]